MSARFEEHMCIGRIMQEEFIRSRLVGYVEQRTGAGLGRKWLTPTAGVRHDSRFHASYRPRQELTIRQRVDGVMGSRTLHDHEMGRR